MSIRRNSDFKVIGNQSCRLNQPLCHEGGGYRVAAITDFGITKGRMVEFVVSKRVQEVNLMNRIDPPIHIMTAPFPPAFNLKDKPDIKKTCPVHDEGHQSVRPICYEFVYVSDFPKRTGSSQDLRF